MRHSGRKKVGPPKIRDKYSGYDKKYRYSIDLRSDGVIEDHIDWCHKHCEGNWGWWYITSKEWETRWDSSGNQAFMSFSRKKEAMKFWFANINLIYDN